VEARAILHSFATDTDITGDAFVDANTGPVSSLLQTGVLGPGSYSLYFISTATTWSSSPPETYLSGLGNSYLQLTAVPLPAAAWLLLSGLAGVGAFARRRRLQASPCL
jgi:hypothetical protein